MTTVTSPTPTTTTATSPTTSPTTVTTAAVLAVPGPPGGAAPVTERTYDLSVTTQGPLYPPSEIVDENGDFVVIGRINRPGPDGGTSAHWGSAVVSADSPVPPFGQHLPYTIVRELPEALAPEDAATALYTLPLPLPCNNYNMLFAPDQRPDAHAVERPSFPLHQAPIPDARFEDGLKVREPIRLGQWVKARGQLEVSLSADRRSAHFSFAFTGLIPDSLYTVMSLREHDLDPDGPTRPGPLGIPNAFMSDQMGMAHYRATLPNPFPEAGSPGANRVINVIVLWMSYQQNYGGAIGHFGLGGDIHAQLKLQGPSFAEFTTIA
ncbi:hypothetical protein GCM10010495_76220 [Kitasatospora herbaricolor]|uniref:hypothetical protein n=1 Tax=Kitasatospora herbaricolor TaxID=68217 RepID=UPI0019BB71AE|nr:hypothetical protein [Kitasatospora herbaricolor]MDQ0313550.1 hypothetical protein [Kitasatospora herbaricolor]GGV47320.1 hypothetical protein GCM10010495_76220 [Kitasatospora herbaricolor]